MESTPDELLTTSKNKPLFVANGYQYRFQRRNNKCMSWLCLKEKKEKCKGKAKTTFDYKILSFTEHSCVPNAAQIDIKKVTEKCKKRVREEISSPVSRIFHEEISRVYNKGYELVSETPKYETVKSALCRERRKILGTTQNPQTHAEIEFPDEVLCLPNKESFLKIDVAVAENKKVFVFAGEDSKYLLKNGHIFFFDGTFKSCPKQFAQIYSIHVDCGSTASETNVYPVLFAFLPDKKEISYTRLFEEIKKWCPEWNPELIKMDFECAALKAVETAFPRSKISGCNFHFNQCLWRKIQDVGLTVQYKDDDEIREACKMCSALSLIPIEYIDEAWLMLMENAPQEDKLSLFISYFVEQWLENQNIPIDMWNVYGQRHRTNNAVEGWNSKLNKLIGTTDPNIYLVVKTLKAVSEEVSHFLKMKELGQVLTQRKKKYIKNDERINNILAEFGRTNDLKKCLKALSYVTKFE